MFQCRADRDCASTFDFRSPRTEGCVAVNRRFSPRWLSAAFWLLGAGFFAIGVRLAFDTTTDGGWDSAANLVAARNIAEGRGFTTDMVQVHVVPQALPGDESVRAPAQVFILGALFRVFGVSLALAVLFNVCVVLLAAIVLRSAASEVAPQWVADVVGILFLLGANNFDLVPILNNNLLVLLTVFALRLAVRAHRGSTIGWVTVCACASLTALAFLTKQSYVVSMVVYSILLVGSARDMSWQRRAIRLAVGASLSLVLTSPYWAVNIVRHGAPIYSPIQRLRLPARYGTEPIGMFQRTVHFGEAPPTYRSIVAELGLRHVLQRELDMIRLLEAALARRGVLVLGLVLMTLPFFRSNSWRLVAIAMALSIAPLFDAMWWLPEDRYLFPLFALYLFVAALGIGDYLASEGSFEPPALARRHRTAFALVAALLVASALLDSRWGWRSEFAAARRSRPAWTEAILALPVDARILTSDVPYVTWWTRRQAVIEPCGDRDQLEQVAALYHPDYYLDILPGPRVDRPPFEVGELTPVTTGEGWQLFRLAVRSRYEQSQVEALKSVRHGSRCPVTNTPSD